MTRFDRVDRQILQCHDDGGTTKKRLLVCDDLFARVPQLATFRSRPRAVPARTAGQLLPGSWRLRQPGGTLGPKEP
jgi:hypothetical protein